METFRCSGCGKIMETIPQCCSQDMVFNEEKNQLLKKNINSWSY